MITVRLACGCHLAVTVAGYAAKTMAAAHPLDRYWHCPRHDTRHAQVEPL